MRKYLVLLIFLAGCASPRGHRVPSHQPKILAPLVMIDAGHGGKDHGTRSKAYEEKELALDTAKYLQRALKQRGYRAQLTRGSDIFIALPERAKMANNAQAQAFVSIHYNSAPNIKANGVEIYYYDGEKNPQRTKASEQLAKKVLHSVVEMTGAKKRTAKHGNFAVVRETNMPAILVEGGFLTNKAERDKIMKKEYQQKIAEGIASGVDKFLTR